MFIFIRKEYQKFAITCLAHSPTLPDIFWRLSTIKLMSRERANACDSSSLIIVPIAASMRNRASSSWSEVSMVLVVDTIEDLNSTVTTDGDLINSIEKFSRTVATATWTFFHCAFLAKVGSVFTIVETMEFKIGSWFFTTWSWAELCCSMWAIIR